MPISFDSALGIHQQALALRSSRAEILASNIANADTPGYKARDIDFKSQLQNIQAQSAQSQSSLSLTHSNSKHIPIDNAAAMNSRTEILYRVPHQPSIDGNTVNEQVEKSAFAENAMRYQASLTFLDGKFKGLMAAIKGE